MEVVRTWTPAREPEAPMTFRQVVEDANTTDDKAVELFVEHYGSGARQDAIDQFGEFGGVEWPVKDPAGKTLGWVGYFYPEALPNYKALDSNDSMDLGWVVGKRYRIWTGDIDIVLGYRNGWVVVQDEKTGQVRSHLTSVSHTDREV